MSVSGGKSLAVDFTDIIAYDSELAKRLVTNPDDYLPALERAALAQLKIEDPHYAEEIEGVRVRLQKLPEDLTVSLRRLGAKHINKLVRVEGIVVRASPVKPLVAKAAFKCKSCEHTQYVLQTGMVMRTPTVCEGCKRKGPFEFLQSESLFIDYQELRIQEKPEDLPPGQLPRWIDIRVYEELVDTARPGDTVIIIGTVRAIQEVLPTAGRMRVFNITLEVDNLEIYGKDPETVEISSEEEKLIVELAKQEDIHEKIKQSIAPSIYGYDEIKEAIMYLLFGGVTKTLQDGTRIRGDINLLVVGDPGTGKSQLLRYVQRIAPRGLYTHGRGTTAAGLTAAVVRERTGGMVLEAGALVLADRGVCAVDEIDKMRNEDRVAMHEAMEQQSISVAKGGIVATLNARTSILAAANPALGRYDPNRTVAENINLPITLLSRFDLIFILKDQPSREYDSRLTEHILKLHSEGGGTVKTLIDPNFLRKYISYSKRIKPRIAQEAMEVIKDFYLKMRGVSEFAESPIAITARQLESIVRLAEARARIALREEVTADDAKRAIALMSKSLEQVGMDIATGKIDIDIIMTGKPKSLRDKLQAVIGVIVSLSKQIGMAEEETVYKVLEEEYGISRSEAANLIQQLRKDGTVYAPKDGFLKKT
ncbi:minichromosome maintenance protein MCM [Candidatus Bathyarchaeota archaeon]|nr:minichromosome maintenance protein MCM [Candidatus Bathyarchaeota archaeon]